ncbi:hypothetical protein AWH63_10505 [Marinobacter sp. C18]|nr:hypothetical protein AWH63_10505 [Marinobacter sp. C18]
MVSHRLYDAIKLTRPWPRRFGSIQEEVVISAYSNKQLVICTGGLPASGTTLVASLLSQSVFAGATRIRVHTGIEEGAARDELDLRRAESLPHTLFEPQYVFNWSNHVDRGRLHDLVNFARDDSRFLLDLSSGAAHIKEQPLSRLLRSWPFLSDFQVDLVLIMKPDAASVYRSRSSIAAYCSPRASNIRVTAVFNAAAGGRSTNESDWERTWYNWSERGALVKHRRLREVRMPALSAQMLAVYRDSVLHHQSRFLEAGVTSMDARRWQRALGDIKQSFSFLSHPLAAIDRT